MKREISFIQYEAEQGIATGAISLELPQSLVEIGESVQYSINGKVLPFYEGAVEFEVVLSDGTVTTLSGNLALWFNKKHVKTAIEAAKKAKEDAAKRAREEELKQARMELLKAFTEEQIQALTALGMLDNEGE